MYLITIGETKHTLICFLSWYHSPFCFELVAVICHVGFGALPFSKGERSILQSVFVILKILYIGIEGRGELIYVDFVTMYKHTKVPNIYVTFFPPTWRKSISVAILQKKTLTLRD